MKTQHTFLDHRVTLSINPDAQDERKRCLACVNDILAFYSSDLEEAKEKAHEFITARVEGRMKDSQLSKP